MLIWKGVVSAFGAGSGVEYPGHAGAGPRELIFATDALRGIRGVRPCERHVGGDNFAPGAKPVGNEFPHELPHELPQEFVKLVGGELGRDMHRPQIGDLHGCLRSPHFTQPGLSHNCHRQINMSKLTSPLAQVARGSEVNGISTPLPSS